MGINLIVLILLRQMLGYLCHVTQLAIDSLTLPPNQN
ncbi:hypothetical protein GLYMA_09G007750v4 [Glycine max]|nr:hypothetical protein GLYMA_09G007750v4 [Glycine max]KAH1040885.1 hypothetical protein GYH30_023645 [Glycine max]